MKYGNIPKLCKCHRQSSEQSFANMYPLYLSFHFRFENNCYTNDYPLSCFSMPCILLLTQWWPKICVRDRRRRTGKDEEFFFFFFLLSSVSLHNPERAAYCIKCIKSRKNGQIYRCVEKTPLSIMQNFALRRAYIILHLQQSMNCSKTNIRRVQFNSLIW